MTKLKVVNGIKEFQEKLIVLRGLEKETIGG